MTRRALQPTLSIVLPCYNPLPDWGQRVIDSIEAITEAVALKELIIVNDGSPQALDTAVARIKKAVSVPVIYLAYAPNRGKGHAVRTGLAQATGDLIIYTDIDFPYTFESLMKIYEALVNRKAEIAVGIKEVDYYHNIHPARKWVSKALRAMIATMLRTKITDTQCGLKGMTQTAKSVWLKGEIDRYLFDLEAIRRASRQRIPMVAIPVSLREGVHLPNMPWSILSKELKNFLKIAFS